MIDFCSYKGVVIYPQRSNFKLPLSMLLLWQCHDAKSISECNIATGFAGISYLNFKKVGFVDERGWKDEKWISLHHSVMGPVCFLVEEYSVKLNVETT